MSHRLLGSLGALMAVIAVVLLTAVPVAGPTSLASFVGVAEASAHRPAQGAPSLSTVRLRSPSTLNSPNGSRGGEGAQAPTPAAGTWTLPRTPDGQPDLQGIWSFATITPLERPDELAGREVLTDEEVAELNQEARTRTDRRDRDPVRDVGAAYNAFWWDRGKSTGRTSLIVDPPDGKVPPLTPEAQKREAGRAEARRGRGPADSWEDRNLAERCIQYRPLPRLPTGYNNNYQILQTPGYVVILTEMIHDVRIIPLDERPHIPHKMRQWNGDSRGRWEGKTLVVETTNFSDKTNFRGSGANLHLIERFTRVDADTIDWQFTVDDPTTWTRPWTGAIPLTKIEGPIYEYACHEGNYGLAGILRGARAEEKAAEEAAKKRR